VSTPAARIDRRIPRFQTSHLGFSLGFPAALYIACNALNLDKLARWFRDADGLDLLALSAYLFGGLCLFVAVFVLFAHRRIIKPFAVMLIIVSAIATYFISKYNVAIDSSMILNAVHTDSTEVEQLLSLQMIPYGIFLLALPLAIVWVTDITFQQGARYLLSSLALFVGALAVGVGALYLNFNAISRAGNISNKYIVYSLVPINLIQSSISATQKTLRPYLRSTRASEALSVRVAAPDDLVVVLAIGESSRRKNFSLYGYDRRDTNPVLRGMDGLHLLEGVAKRGSTLIALPEILEKQGIKLPTAVAKAGVPTACYVNYTLYDNCADVGEVKVSHCGHGGKCYDEDVIPLLQENLRKYSAGYEFVILHLGGGSHGPAYGDRHPPEFLRFEPRCTDADVANRCTVEQIFNSYDNTILYVDHVVGQIIQTLDRSRVRYVFIYLSDHGESLLEGGYLFHGMPPGMALPAEQAEIPLIVKASIPISIVEREQYLQPEVFDTVLDLFTIESPTFDKAVSFIRKQ
jgi:lipid A ethanolaminephosphotransferase